MHGMNRLLLLESSEKGNTRHPWQNYKGLDYIWELPKPQK